jgi:hypothetical protein
MKKKKIYYELEKGYIAEAVSLKYIPIIGLYKIIYRDIFTKECKICFDFWWNIFDR